VIIPVNSTKIDFLSIIKDSRQTQLGYEMKSLHSRTFSILLYKSRFTKQSMLARMHGEKEPLYTVSGNVMEVSMEVPQKLKIELPI
jgi:hypothetical protein